MIHIILADHHAQALWALNMMIHEQPGLEVIGEAVDAESLFALAAEGFPELVLVDGDLPGRPIEDLIAELHALNPNITVIVMSSRPEEGRRVLRAGADAFVSKGDQPDWLLTSLQKFVKNAERKEEARRND